MIAIAAPSYREQIGGRVVLHKLCDILIRRGYPAYLVPLATTADRLRTCPRYRSEVRDTVAPGDVVVYPDIVRGNPFNASRVIRWNLYHPRYAADPGDQVWFYSAQFGEPCLTVMDPRLEVFHLPPSLPARQRTGTVWAWRKARKQGWTEDEKPTHLGPELDPGLSLTDLRDVFWRAARFETWDNATFMAYQARLCGCEVVIHSKTPLAEQVAHVASTDPTDLRYQLIQQQVDQGRAVAAWADAVIRWRNQHG